MVIGGAGSPQSGVVQPKTTLFIVNNNEKQWQERLPRARQPQVARARPAAVPAAYEIVRGIFAHA
jgi:hypothetical protein